MSGSRGRRAVRRPQRRPRAGSKVDVKEVTDREKLRESYRRASLATRGSLAKEVDELDHLAAEGLDE